MSRSDIIGRRRELEDLDWCMKSDSAQLVVVYGRRRVGKTYLINNYFNNEFAFHLTGSFQQPKKVQLRNFSEEMSRRLERNVSTPKDWSDAFFLLREYISSLPKDEKQVVFFDEMPWMDGAKSGFLPAFEFFWNDFGAARSNLVFIVCGSASSWLSDNIAHNKGGLFNRVTSSILLEPFSLGEMEEYLEKKGFQWSRYIIAMCYMVMGGVPYYLSLLKNTLTLEENVDALFFHRSGKLRNEFFELYRTLFSNSEAHIRIVEALGGKRSGLTLGEIAQNAKIPLNGNLGHYIDNLKNSGFVRSFSSFGKKKKDMKYQLSDPFSLFYLFFVKGNDGGDEAFWRNSLDSPSVRTWKGLAFENVCLNHTREIKKALRIDNILTESSVWQVSADEDHGGAQIDMVLDRKDHIINLLEAKFSDEEYIIDAQMEKKLRNKVSIFRAVTGTRKALHLTMITTYGVLKNKYSGVAGEEIVLDDLFC